MSDSLHHQIEATLSAVASGVAAESGPAFFDSLAQHLAEALEVSHAFVGKVDLLDLEAETIAVFSHGEQRKNFRYALADTPCENVVDQVVCIHEQNVQRAYPRDEMLVQMGVESYAGVPLIDSEGRTNGLLVVLSESPLHSRRLVESVLRVFGVRAATELERQRKEDELHGIIAALEDARRQLEDSHAELEQRVEQRTDLLQALNDELKQEIEDRKDLEHSLRREQSVLQQLYEMQEKERQLFAHEIHDGILQYAIGAQMHAEVALESPCLAESSNASLRKDLSRLRDLLLRTVVDGRHLLNGLRPPALDEFGIVPAVEDLVESLALAEISVEFEHDQAIDRLPAMLESSLYRIA
ncbi:MAG: histidine kinase, partial [Planctomycetales bacterium]